jgi:tetratricopeptide (TPR) repeat protein
MKSNYLRDIPMFDNQTIANTLKAWNLDAMQCVQDKRYQEAINKFKKALKIEETLQIHREAGQTLINMANVYYMMGQYAPALKILKCAESKFKDDCDSDTIYNLQSMNGLLHFLLKHYPTSLSHYKKCLELPVDQNKKAKTQYQLACVYYKMKNIGFAMEHVNVAILIFSKTSNSSGRRDCETLLRKIKNMFFDI